MLGAMEYGQQGKAFFFEKKKQKAFVCAVADLFEKVRVSAGKDFWFVFLKKDGFLDSLSRPVGIRTPFAPGLY
jgi:hypothetical protein